MLPKANRLVGEENFRRVKRLGRVYSTRLFSLVAAPARERLGRRFGLVVSTRFDRRAVVRNRARRRLARAVAANLEKFPVGGEVIIYAKAGLKDQDDEAVNTALNSLLPKVSLA